MPRSPYQTVMILLVTCSVLLTQSATTAQKLSGTTLQPVATTDTIVGSLLDRLVSGSKRDPQPVIDRVVVTQDVADRVVLNITYSGLANCMIAAEVRGTDRRPHPHIAVERVRVAAPAGVVTIALALQAPEGADLSAESAYLWLTGAEVGRESVPIVSRLFRLPKVWQLTAGGPRLAKVAPQPLGTAATLGARPDYARPPKVLVPMHDVRETAAPANVRDHRGIDPRRERRAPSPASPPPPAATPPPAVNLPPAVLAQRRATAAQTTAATSKLPQGGAVAKLERFPFGVKPEDAQKGAQGPSATPIELLEGLSTEDIDINPARLLSIASSIYPDKTPNLGVFYYHPRSYHLEWSPENGHGMRILYGAASTAGAAGDVLMAARLQSGLDFSEVQLATELLRAYQRRNKSTVVPVLRPLPLQKDGLDVSLASVLGQYSIPKEKIAITGLSDVLGEIEVSWVTDPVTKENLQLALAQDVGVNGMVAFVAAGGALAPQVPIAIQLADRDSFGRVRWNRSDGYRNNTPYPVRLRYLHALVIDPNSNLPLLYTWSLGNVEVAPRSAVEWDAAKVPAWIDTEAKRVWVDYGVVQTCDACDRQVLDTITGGVTSVAAEQITFHTITPLADVGGYEITARLRSKYFDPKDRALLQKTVVLKADGQDFTVGPVYSGAAVAGEPLFEYQLDLTMPDGSSHKGTRWIASESLRVLVGRSQLEQSIGTLPGR
jgi:hypothetical protein